MVADSELVGSGGGRARRWRTVEEKQWIVEQTLPPIVRLFYDLGFLACLRQGLAVQSQSPELSDACRTERRLPSWK
jgi:hypothetical protein